MNGLFLFSDDNASPVTEQRYDTELELQNIVAKNPHLLLEKQDNGRELILIQQEFALPEYQDGANTFSLDHLMVDNEGIPALVEIKRSTDTRVRREVIAQMLDYAARMATVNANDLRSLFVQNNDSPELLARYDTEDFWDKVAINLKAERMSLYFVADTIPDTLLTLIEFLRRNMTSITLYGVEVKQYRSEDAMLLSATFVGGSQPERVKLNAPSIAWDANSFADKLHIFHDDGLATVCQSLRQHSETLSVPIVFGRGAKNPTFRAVLDGLTIFKVELYQLDTQPKCSLEFCLPDLLRVLPMYSESTLRTALTDFPNRDVALANKDIWITNQYVYYRLAYFKEEKNLSCLCNILSKLQEQLVSQQK